MSDNGDDIPGSADVVVIGASLTGLIAAWEMARTGLSVVLLDAAADSGSATASINLVASVIRDPTGVLAELIQALQLEDLALNYSAPQLGISQPDGLPLVLSYDNILGIPASPLDRAVRALVGRRHSLRGYLDRLKPVLTIGKEQFIGPLVRDRLGAAIASRLVEPVIRDRFGSASGDVEVAAAVPGLNEALTRTGSLSGAVLALAEEAVSRDKLHSLVGGLAVLATTLRERITFFNGIIVPATRAVSIGAGSATVGRDWSVTLHDGAVVSASSVIVACEAENVDLDCGTGRELERILTSRDSVRGLRQSLGAKVYSITVMRLAQGVLAGVPGYVVAANESSNIVRVEQISSLWPETVAAGTAETDGVAVNPAAVGAERAALPPAASDYLRVVQRVASPSLSALTVELAEFLGLATPPAAELIQSGVAALPVELKMIIRADPDQPRTPASKSVARTAERTGSQPEASVVFLPSWPMDAPLDTVVAVTQTVVTGVRRKILGLV